MQEIDQKSHNIVPNSMVKSNQTNKAQSAKQLFQNRHTVSVLQPLELKIYSHMLGINKLNISKLKLIRERIDKKREEKESLCLRRSLDSSLSPCF